MSLYRTPFIITSLDLRSSEYYKVHRESEIFQVSQFRLSEFRQHRGITPRSDGVAMAPPDFGRSVDPISTRREKLYLSTYLITTGTPAFSCLPTALKSAIS